MEDAPNFFVPKDWAKFFTALLLSPSHFKKAKEFVKNSSFLSCINDSDGLGFLIPSGPINSPPVCSLIGSDDLLSAGDPMEPPVSPVISSDKSPSVGDSLILSSETSDETEKMLRSRKKKVILVESEVRRSSRISKSKNGFKDPVCNVKHCLGCNSKPPTLSSKAIRNLSSSFYDLEAS